MSEREAAVLSDEPERRVTSNDVQELWVKDLEDWSRAVRRVEWRRIIAERPIHT